MESLGHSNVLLTWSWPVSSKKQFVASAKPIARTDVWVKIRILASQHPMITCDRNVIWVQKIDSPNQRPTLQSKELTIWKISVNQVSLIYHTFLLNNCLFSQFILIYFNKLNLIVHVLHWNLQLDMACKNIR